MRDLVLPRGEAIRRVPLGMTAGVRALIDFRLDTLFFLGLNERELTPHIRRLVRPGSRCFDIGGYRGWSALAFATVSRGPVVVFEGEGSNAALIGRTAAASGLDIRVVQTLIGGRDGDGWTTIDRAARTHFVPDFIKLDIEGGEVDALAGAAWVLSRRPSLIVEVHGEDKEEGCLKILRGAGYAPAIVEQRPGVFHEGRGAIHNRWLVCQGGGAQG